MSHELRKALAIITDAMYQDPNVIQEIMDEIEEAQRGVAQARYVERQKQNVLL